MFDTEKFILAIQSRESIWNTRSIKYYDKEKRSKAWDEVGAVMYEGFDSCSTKKRDEIVQELQKKWKHLRDYFVREKNKELQQTTVPRKKRKAPFLDLLNEFMHVKKTPASPISLKQPEDADFENNSSHATLNNQFQRDLDPNMVFLLSIFPEMQTMDERQTFEFKLEVMNLINRIKYNDPNYYNRPAGTSNDYKIPYHMIGNQHYDVPPNGSNSSVSEHSEEILSFLPPKICLIEKEEIEDEIQEEIEEDIQEDFSAEEEKIM